MYGAIIGDFIGSIYEFKEFKDSIKKVINKKRREESSKEKTLFKDNCFYSDDTILTIAVLDAILSNKSYEKTIKEYAKDTSIICQTKEETFPNPFSLRFIKWCNNEIPNNSIGNGAAMRISPIAYMFNDLEKILIEVEKCTSISHNTQEAINGAKAVASAIYLSRKKLSKEQIKIYIEKHFNYDLNFDLEKLHNEYLFSSTSSTSVPHAIYIFLISNSFEEVMRNALYIGGDTDTIACIACSIGEAYFGIDSKLIDIANKKLPNKFINLLNEAYKRINITKKASL